MIQSHGERFLTLHSFYPVLASLSLFPCGPLLSVNLPISFLPSGLCACGALHLEFFPSSLTYGWFLLILQSSVQMLLLQARLPCPRGWNLVLVVPDHISLVWFFLGKHIKLSWLLFAFSMIIDCRPMVAGLTPTLVTCVSPFLAWCPTRCSPSWRCAAHVDQLLWGGVLCEEALAANSGNPN